MSLPLAKGANANRKLPQRRPWRTRLPSVRALGRGARAGLRAAAPTLCVLGALAGLGTGAMFAARWLRTSPRFALRTIDVTGNSRVATSALLRRAGIAAGANLFSVPIRATEARLRSDPWIAEAEVRRRLPDGLAIHVVERQPAALVLAAGAAAGSTAGATGLYLADAAGHVFKRAAVDAGEGAGLPVVSGLERHLFADEPELAAQLVRRALDLAAAWRAKDRPPLGEVHVGKDGLTLYTLDGATAVALGRPADDAAALRRFDATWAALPPDERAQARTIHLDSRTRPDRVTVSFADPGTK
jgi:cell division protein FtsQ